MKYLRLLAVLLFVPLAAAFVRGGSPVPATSAGCTDSVPPMASAFGMSTCTFYDSMQSSSTVDLNSSGTAGFNWYTQNSFSLAAFTASISATTMAVTSVDAVTDPASGKATPQIGMTISCGAGGTCPTAGTKITACPGGTCGGTGNYTVDTSQTVSSGQMIASFAQQPASLSFSAAGLSIINVAQGLNNYSLGTTHILLPSTGSPMPYHGISFKGGMYQRSYVAFDESKSSGGCTHGLADCRWPSPWMYSYPGVAYGADAVEVDTCDCVPNPGPVFTIEDFLHEPAKSADSNWNQPARATAVCNPVFDGVVFHTIDQLWVPTTLNSGTGIYAFIWDYDTCATAGGVFTGHISGTTLTVDSGSPKLGQDVWFSCTNCAANSQIQSCSSSTVCTIKGGSQTVSSQTIVAANGNTCAYFLSPGQAGCTDTPSAGVFAQPELTGNGFTLLMAAGCSATVVGTPTGSECVGNTTYKVKNYEVWQTSLSNKVVQ